MRTTPYANITTPVKTSAPAETELLEVNKQTYQQSKVTDLSSLLARKVDPVKTEEKAPETEITTTTEQQTTETPKPEPGPTSSATLNEDMQKQIGELKDKISEEIKSTVSNPKRAAENALHLFNLARAFGIPWLYKKILFTQAEVQAIEAIMKKVVAAGLKGEEVKLNEFEQKLRNDWAFFQKHSAEVPYTREEIAVLAELGYMQFARIKFLNWLMEHEFAIAFIIIEGRRFAPVIAKKMGFGEMSIDKLLFMPSK